MTGRAVHRISLLRCQAVSRAATSISTATLPAAAMQTALHEFGHALGLIHEFQNPAAGKLFDSSVVLREFTNPPNNLTRETVEKNLLAKVEPQEPRRYDRYSIMNYSFPSSFFLDSSKATLPGNHLSENDKKYVESLYPRQYPGAAFEANLTEFDWPTGLSFRSAFSGLIR